ncbi:MAG: hypothetical protein FWC41_08550 [Firmicutes bacterium]|nr:hypothetical protein [Bacillota bacterium]
MKRIEFLTIQEVADRIKELKQKGFPEFLFYTYFEREVIRIEGGQEKWII